MSSEQKRIAEVYATNKDLVAIFNEQSVGPKRLQILKWIKDLIEKPKHAHKEEEKLSGLEVEPATIVEIKNGDMEHRMCYFNKMLETLLFEFNVARQKDGNIYVRSLTFKRWKERKVRLDEDQNVFIIYSKKKEKKLNLTTYSVKWVGQKKEYQAFSLDSVSAQNKYKQLLFGWVNFDGARVWHDSILRLLSKIPGSTVPLNREAMSIQVQSSQALFNQNMNQSVIVASSNLKPHEQITQSAYQPQIKRKASLNMEEQLEKAEKPTESLQLNIQSKANKKEENELKKAPSQQLPTSESSDNESPGLKSQRQHQQKEVINVNSVSNATQQVQKYPNLKETAPATANNATQNSQTNEKKQLEQKEQHQQQQQIQQQQQQQQQIQQQQQQQQQQQVEKQQPQLEKKENSQAQQQPINTNIQQQNTSTERNGNISSPQKESQQPPQQVEKKEVIKVQAQVQEQQIQQHQEAPSHQNGIEQKQEQHQPQQSQEEQKQQQQQQKQQQKESKQQQKQASELVDYHLEHLDDIKTPQTVSDFLSEYKLSSITDERDFKTVSFNNGMRLLQSTEDPRRFKILIAFQGVSCFEIFNCISNVDDYSKWNSNVAETRVLNIMKNEQTAILYQKHKGIGIMYRPRDFVYLRHAFVKDQQYYIVDKSVEYDSLPSSISIVRGEIEHVVWCFQTHPQDEGRSLMIADLYYSNSGYSNKEQDASITFAYLNNFSNLTTFITQKTFQKSIAINMFDVADQSQLKRSQIRAQEREEKSQKPVQQDSHQQQHSELSNQVIGSNVSVSSSVQPQSVESHNQDKHLLQVENQQPIQQARKEMTKTEENCEDTQPSSNSNINIKTSQEQIEDDEKSQMRHIYEEEEQQNAQLNSELNKFSEEIHKDDTEYTMEVTNQVAPQIDLLNENVFNQPGDKLAGMTIMEIIDFVNKNKHWGICVDQKYNMGRIDGPSKFLESTQERGHYQFKKDWDRDTKTGKFIFLNKEKIATQKKVISFLLSKIGSNILSGKSITSISLPIDIFEPRSNLERFAYASSFAPIYLKRAAESSDPVEQMKNCAVYLITTTIMYLDLEKPFNPILGETYQGRLDGYPIYCEQISHHPPICSYSYYTDGYKLQGNLESIASMHANSVTGINQGNVFVKFYKTGNEIGLIQAPGSLNGTAFGTRYMSVDGKYLAYDIKNKLVMDLKVNPDKKGFFKSAGNTIDYMAGGIYRVTDKFIAKLKALKPHYYKFQGLNKDDIIGEPLSVITGIWNQEVLVDGVKWYDLQSPLPYKLEHELNPIPSDCNYRQDILYLKDRNLKEGQITKEVLENYQRADRKLREKAHELRKKALKKLKK